jgi:hypothetical protein
MYPFLLYNYFGPLIHALWKRSNPPAPYVIVSALPCTDRTCRAVCEAISSHLKIASPALAARVPALSRLGQDGAVPWTVCHPGQACAGRCKRRQERPPSNDMKREVCDLNRTLFDRFRAVLKSGFGDCMAGEASHTIPRILFSPALERS